MDMSGVLLFLHVLGFTLWFGVTFALAMVTVRASRGDQREITAFCYRTASRLLRGPALVGMLLTIGSGFTLSGVRGYGVFQPFPNHWLFQMQILGTVAMLLMLLVQIPNADRLARAAEAAAAAGEETAAFVRFRKRSALVGSGIGLLLLVSMFMGAVRPG